MRLSRSFLQCALLALCLSLVVADSCSDFRRQLKDKYHSKHKTLGYKLARQYMYNYIDNFDNTVECVYGGGVFPFKPTNGTDIKNINCEHTIPQSFFKKKNPYVSDLHHLFPSYPQFNSIRSNFPFKNLSIAETDKWMIDTEVTKQVPQSHIQEYSRGTNGGFTPRDQHKGPLARSILYFFTMYPEACKIEQVADVKLLLAWHHQFPPLRGEKLRNERIQYVQDSINPFVLYPDLTREAFENCL
ncbi:hypothetical protein P9112_006412 [Eukaryota sp. TZLM1-RC]